MTLMERTIFGFAGIAAYLGLAATSASAQQATFTLPVEAHWGRIVLEPGDYKVRFPDATRQRILSVTGNGKTVNILLQGSETQHEGEKAHLLLVEVDGQERVASITAADGEKAFTFALPKGEKSRRGLSSHAKIQVPVKEARQS